MLNDRSLDESNSDFSSDEIDLSKLKGLDVDSIVDLFNTQQQESEQDNAQDSETDQEDTNEELFTSDDDPIFELKVSSDRLFAFIKAKFDSPEREITKKEVINFLKQQNIKYGICEEEIEDFCKSKDYYQETVVARGKPPVNGDDGEIEYKFSKRVNLQPTVRDDGTVDYKELGFVQSVSKGEVLCELKPATAGEPGIDVYGDPIPHSEGKNPEFPPGENTTVSEDGTKLLAAKDGCIVFNSRTVSVKEIFILDGDVDTSSGNIIFNGTVKINGDVREGFTVKAGQDVIVKGVVEGAVIEAGQDIVISEGVNAMGIGRLYAKGNIVSAFIENANVECDGDVTSNAIMNSTVKAKGSITLKGVRGAIIGGTCTAGKMIYANNIGTERYTPTHVEIQSPALNELLLTGDAIHQYNNSLTKSAQLEKEISKAEVYIEKFERMPELNDKETILHRALTAKLKELKKELEAVQQKIEESQKELVSLHDFKIIAVKKMFPGTKITIGCYYKNIEATEQSVKFFADINGISQGRPSVSEKI